MATKLSRPWLDSTGAAFAQAPLSFVASPEVYKVITENAQYRIIAATWQPGQRDKPHAHPAAGIYFLTDCRVRKHAPDGTFREGERRAGHSAVQEPVPAHAFENIGTSACRLIMFEPR